jgi:hypothetical protein
MTKRPLTVEVFEGKKPKSKQRWFFHVLWENGIPGLTSEGYVTFPAAFKYAMKLHLRLDLSRFVVPEKKQGYLQRWLRKNDRIKGV